MSLNLVNCWFRGLRIPSLLGRSAECHIFFSAIWKSRKEVAVMIEKNIKHVVMEKKDEKKDNFLVIILFFLLLMLGISTPDLLMWLH